MVYKERYRIGIEDVAHNSQATNKALLSIMEDIACAHSADVGYGVLEVETKHRAWVLLDWMHQHGQERLTDCVHTEILN